MSYRCSIAFGLALAFSTVSPAQTPPSPATTGAANTGQYRNLFKEYLGKSDADLSAKLQSTWQQLFYGDENRERLFYSVPGDMAYVPDLDNNDIRTEGLSYGMMLCVQTDHQKEFNQIWRYARHYMYYNSGPLRGYFAWHTGFDGRRLSPGPADDGEEWFTMALFFAAYRWGNGEGIFNYEAEAQSILHTMLHKEEDLDRGPMTNMIDHESKEINFVPQGMGAHYTDASYHLPHYYELWARWSNSTEDRAFLAQMAPTSRAFFKKASDPKTGLMPDCSEFDGKPLARFARNEFRYDAWRTLAYPALDYAWWGGDRWPVEEANRVLTFLAKQGPNCIDRFKLDGTPIGEDINTPGLFAMAGVAALAADREVGQPFVQHLWEMKIPDGRKRYYDGLLTYLALLEVSGNFRIYWPAQGAH